MKKVLNILIVIIALLLAVSCDQIKLSGGGEGGGGEGDGVVSWAGIRVSDYGMKESYGEDNFPSETKMKELMGKMASYYDGSTGTAILIVGTITTKEEDNGDVEKGSCSLKFPLSKKIANARGYESVDVYESYLTAFDKAGYSVWLQVEPGDADLVELATEVMSHYSKHKCVKGFGIDVEWYKYRYNAQKDEETSSKLSDEEAKKVVDAVKKIKSDYTVFVKHWDERWLPETYRNGLVFINDSQGFRSERGRSALENMRDEFADWAETFAPSPVMFQIGYKADKWIWSQFKNPAKELGAYIAEGCTYGNKLGIIWVDFTLNQVL